MGIFFNVKAGIKLAKLKKQAEKAPTPTVIGELARHYIHSGNNDLAFVLIKKGLDLFPDSEIVNSIWSFLKKSKEGAKIREALDALETEPTAENFLTVINIYKNFKDIDSQAEFCRKFIAEFPDNGDAHRLMAEIRFFRFIHNYSSLDGRVAKDALEKALSINPNDASALFLQAKLYAYCGFITKAKANLDQILSNAEEEDEHEEALALKEALEDASPVDEDEDILFRFSAIEETKRFFFRDSDELEDEEELSELDLALMSTSLSEALAIDGVESAIFASPNGERCGCGQSDPDKNEHDPEYDWDSFGQFSDRIAKVARKASLRMDIGTFEGGIVEGSEGGVVLKDTKEGLLGFFLRDRRSLVRSKEQLHALVEELVMGGGNNNE